MDKHYIPRYLDEPFNIAFLTVDEILSLIIPVLSGLFLFNSPIIGLCIGSIIVTLLKTMKGSEGHYFMYHMAYWYLPPIIKFRSTPPSYIRQIIG